MAALQMKVLHVYKDYNPPVYGGIEGHVALSCRLQREWAETAALVCGRRLRTRTIDRDGVSVTEVGEWGRFQGAPVAPAFPFHLWRSRADVLVVHIPNPAAAIGCLLARPRGVIVVRYHSDVVRQARAMRVYGPVQMQFLKQAAIILPTSMHYLDSSATLAAVRGRCRVVPLGVLSDAFAKPTPGGAETLRQRYGGRYVLFSGRHRYYKGLEYLVHASASIRAKVVIAGEGPERANTMQLAGRLGLDTAFPGELNHQELVDHLHGCEVFVFPAIERSEALGVSILEAHACGKPVVATRLGTGVEFANLDGETGLNVLPKDAQALAEAVNALLDDPKRRRAMGETAQARVSAEFDARRVAREEVDIYAEMLERHGRKRGEAPR